MKLIKKTLKKEIAQRLSASVKLKGIREIDVTDLWKDNADDLLEIFDFSEWEFFKLNHRIKFRHFDV